MDFRILNLEGHQHCLISSKVKILAPLKKIKHSHVGCLSRGNRLEYCDAHSDLILGEIKKKQGLKTYKIGLISESVLWDPTSDILAQIKI